jgi:hypothetical protein
MSRPGLASDRKVKRSASVPKACNARGELLARALSIYLLGLFGVHQAAGTLLDQRFEADAVDQVDRVEHIALRLAHFLAFGVADQAVHVDVPERKLAGECRVIITMRATQKKMMSKPVTSTVDGR